MLLFLLGSLLGSPLLGANAVPPTYVKAPEWSRTMQLSRDALLQSGTGSPAELLEQVEDGFPVQWDWFLQDAGPRAAEWFDRAKTGEITLGMIRKVLQELGPEGAAFQAELETALARSLDPVAPQWLELYERAAAKRRAMRLKPLAKMQLLFTKHYNLGGSHYAYTEGQSDAQAERHFIPGSALCLLEIDGGNLRVRTLLEDPNGVIREPAVSYDGKRVLFAWKKSDREDDYHLYEMEVATGKTRQLTSGLGFADYEGTYLPNGDILFNSTRCVQTVDCWWTEVSNLYTCDKDGRFLRRVTFDQVHDNFPTVLDDGRVLYTRWEYNDRGQLYPQPLFQMNPDGTGQTEFYGNNSWFPTSILHARGIPGTGKVLALASGHHCFQAGKLAIIDPARGRQEAEGVQLVAPIRQAKAERIDAYGQQGELFQYPYPLSEQLYLVTYHPLGWTERRERKEQPHFKVYLMTTDARREVLAADPAISCNQPVPLAARPVPVNRASMVDYRQSAGTYSMQNIYAGKALPGVAKGTIKRLRVVALDYRAAGIGQNHSGGPAGGALCSTPPSIDNGSWDPKIVLGDATVHEDGSAFFQAPARVPLFFMALDANGHTVQTMRSWSMLQPGENASCVGCHEDKNAPALATPRVTQAMRAGPEPLTPFYGPARPFSFATEIQPILDQKCVSCHSERSHLAAENKKRLITELGGKFSLLGEFNLDTKAKRQWSDAYLNLTNWGKTNDLVNWIGAQSVPSMLPPYFAGAARSGLVQLLATGHHDVKLSREELEKIACWIDLLVPFCADYREAAAWDPESHGKYDHFLQKRRRMQESERAAIEAMLANTHGPQPPVEIRLVNQAGVAGPADRPRVPGDRIEIRGPSRMMIRLSPQLPETLVYSPDGWVRFPVPFDSKEAKAYPPNAFSAGQITARPASDADLKTYRNLAANPYDVRGLSGVFPHATSNSECRNDPVFAARNAIDGSITNRKHGAWPNQSWGPDPRKDLWWKVDFGRPVQVDKLVVLVRADFPHDSAWTSATVRFSDGSTEKISLRAVAEPQTFSFKQRVATWVELTDLVCDKPRAWCALSEVEVHGREAASVISAAR